MPCQMFHHAIFARPQEVQVLVFSPFSNCLSSLLHLCWWGGWRLEGRSLAFLSTPGNLLSPRLKLSGVKAGSKSGACTWTLELWMLELLPCLPVPCAGIGIIYEVGHPGPASSWGRWISGRSPEHLLVHALPAMQDKIVRTAACLINIPGNSHQRSAGFLELFYDD